MNLNNILLLLQYCNCLEGLENSCHDFTRFSTLASRRLEPF